MSADGDRYRSPPVTRLALLAALALLGPACSLAPPAEPPLADQSPAGLMDQARLHYVRAITHLRHDRREPAIAELDLAIALHPLPEYLALRGHAHAELARIDEARADLDQALVLDPDHERAHFDRAMLAHALGETDLAMADIALALARAPQESRFLGGRCVIGIAAGEPAELALTYCEQALRLRPPHANAYTARGQAYLQLRREREALADFERALLEHPAHMRALYGRGLARLRLGDIGGRQDLHTATHHLPGAGREYLPPPDTP